MKTICILFLAVTTACGALAEPPTVALGKLAEKESPNQVPEDTARKLADPQR